MLEQDLILYGDGLPRLLSSQPIMISRLIISKVGRCSGSHALTVYHLGFGNENGLLVAEASATIDALVSYPRDLRSL